VGARSLPSARAVIEDDAVDAIIVASPAEFHAELSLLSIAAGKPVLCEKPLAPTNDECQIVVDAELEKGRRFVSLGFMRRYDAAYRHLREQLDGDKIGIPLHLRCVHRNPDVPPTFTSEMSMTDAVIHEIDCARWLLGEEISSVRVISGKSTPDAPHGLRDPQLVIMESTSGVLVSVEIFVAAQFGYDVRCEVSGSRGFSSMGYQDLGDYVSVAGRHSPFSPNWRVRFGEAYRLEIQDWVNGLAVGEIRGANAFDGLAATTVAQAGVQAVRTGDIVPVHLPTRPSLYD
jgi:myo-inositol 2-dehydrogenase/D-chiro-inositol 1-dehydrogenase